MHLPPVSVIAKWPTPNYVNPENHGPGLLIADIILMVVVLVVIGVRFYTRLRVTKKLGPDDLLIGLALVHTLLFPPTLAQFTDRRVDPDHRSLIDADSLLRPLEIRSAHLGCDAVDHHGLYQIRDDKATALLRRIDSHQTLARVFLPPSHLQQWAPTI